MSMVHYAANCIMSKSVSLNSYKHSIKQSMTMKQFFITMFSNNEGTSHKRVLGTIGFISLIVFLFISSETHKAEAISAVEYITIATVFGTVVEKFAGKKNNTTPEI